MFKPKIQSINKLISDQSILESVLIYDHRPGFIFIL